MKLALHISLLLAALGLLLWMNSLAKAARVVPARTGQAPSAISVDSQKQIYAIYKRAGLRGARVVHLSRFLNLVDYLPREENISRPFPIRIGDIRPLYEKGLNAHNWLFIANRTELVRSAVVVLPAPVLRERIAGFLGHYAYSVSGDVVRGHTYDMPLLVTTLDAMPTISEPVIVNADAGYFMDGEDPGRVLELLRKNCPDARGMVISWSSDEPDIGEDARERLLEFAQGWAGVR